MHSLSQLELRKLGVMMENFKGLDFEFQFLNGPWGRLPIKIAQTLFSESFLRRDFNTDAIQEENNRFDD